MGEEHILKHTEDLFDQAVFRYLRDAQVELKIVDGIHLSIARPAVLYHLVQMLGELVKLLIGASLCRENAALHLKALAEFEYLDDVFGFQDEHRGQGAAQVGGGRELPDVGPVAALALQDSQGAQPLEGSPHGDATDSKHVCQIVFRREFRARQPPLAGDVRSDLFEHLFTDARLVYLLDACQIDPPCESI